jgi:lambda family phage minor tail protein L
MGQGQDKVALSLLDLQPTAIVELFLLYFNSVDKENVFIAFHGGSVFSENIKWQGVEYLPIPVESEGFEVNANGQMPRPKIRISNKDYFVTDLLINNNDLQFAKLIRKRTFVKHLDDENFDGGNPWGQADATAEISNDTFVIGQKTAENKVFVELELTSPLDLDNFDVNNRLILSRYCSWYYRGNGCNYQGPPVETEDGRKLNYKSGIQWYSGMVQWNTGINFEVGDIAYIDNKKIRVFDPQDSNKYDYAKIMYVCQKDHTSSFKRQPDVDQNFWLRDGCNKKLDGCKKRFQSTSKAQGNTEDFVVTNDFIDFSHKAGLYAYNNIAPQAYITKSSQKDSTKYSAKNVIDQSTGFGSYSWAVDSATDTERWIQLNWGTPKTINRIDLYDLPSTNNNFNNAYITFYNGASVVKSGLLRNIPDDGSRITSGFSNIDVTAIRVSGSGSAGSQVGLGEIAVFEPTGLKVYAPDFNTDEIHRSNFWQISSWIQFPNGLSKTDEYNAVLHNVEENCRYSGINLFVSGSEMVLNFATVIASGSPIQYVTKNRRLSIGWPVKNLKPFHIMCSGGVTAGATPTSFNNGYITLSDGSNEKTYQLLTRNTSDKISGEFFLFKNGAYQDGIGDLKLGINDWRFSDLQATPDAGSNAVTSNLEITSNIVFGSTAIWTGSKNLSNKIDFFNRTDEKSKLTNAAAAGLMPRKYSELDNSIRQNLYAWWDMDMTNSPPYKVEAANNSDRELYLQGDYQSSITTSETTIYTKGNDTAQSAAQYLPFGGFPGTDRYGR